MEFFPFILRQQIRCYQLNRVRVWPNDEMSCFNQKKGLVCLNSTKRQ